MKQELGVIQSSQTIKFICQIQLSVSTIHVNKMLEDPTAEVIFKAEAICLEYEPGRTFEIQSRTRVLRVDVEKKRLWWEYIAGKYEAINHDEMFGKVMKMIEEINK